MSGPQIEQCLQGSARALETRPKSSRATKRVPILVSRGNLTLKEEGKRAELLWIFVD